VVPLALHSCVIRNTLYIKLGYEFKHKLYAERIIILPMYLSTTCVMSKILHKVSKITNEKEDISNNIHKAAVLETAKLSANLCVRSWLLTELVITSVQHVLIKYTNQFMAWGSLRS